MKENRKCNVWVMTHEYEPFIIGGLGIVATQLSQALSRSGVEVTVICSGSAKRLASSKLSGKLRIVRLPKRSGHYRAGSGTYKAGPVIRAAQSAGAGKPDLIHAHSTEFADAAIAAGRLYRIPIVYTCHSIASAGPNSTPGRNQTKLIRSAIQIVTPSKWQAEALGKLYAGARGKVVVIPNGVMAVPNRHRGDPYQLLYVGRLIPSKGLEPLINAVATLSRESNRVRLTVVGSGKPSYVNRLRMLAGQLRITNRIRWIRHLPHDQVQRMYASYGAVVVPSRKESFCLVALEAMAHGVPLVCTRSGGLKDFANAGNAQIIRSATREEVAKAIARMWNQPAKTKQRLAKARQTAKRYRWPAIALRYQSMIESLKKGNLK